MDESLVPQPVWQRGPGSGIIRYAVVNNCVRLTEIVQIGLAHSVYVLEPAALGSWGNHQRSTHETLEAAWSVAVQRAAKAHKLAQALQLVAATPGVVDNPKVRRDAEAVTNSRRASEATWAVVAGLLKESSK